MADDTIVTASVVEYQAVRPDGTVIWTYAVPSHSDTFLAPWSPGRGLTLTINGLGPVSPPWVLQRREYGPEWVTIAERD